MICSLSMCRHVAIILIFPFISCSYASSDSSSQSVNLGYPEYLEYVLNTNTELRAKQLDWEIAKQSVGSAETDFNPNLVSQLGIEKNHIPNTISDQQSYGLLGLSGGDVSQYSEKNHKLSIGIEQKFKTGATIQLSNTIAKLKNSRQSGSTYDRETKSFLGVTVIQPLLKGLGENSESNAKLRVANIERDIAFQTYRKAIMETIQKASSAYWGLYLAEEKQAIRQGSVGLTDRIYQDTKVRIDKGYSPSLEADTISTGLARRELQQSETAREVSEQTAIVSQFLTSSMIKSKVSARDSLYFEKASYNQEKSITQSKLLNPDYKIAKLKTAQEDIRSAYAKNQKLPQLNLKASYGLNGLETTTDEAFKNLTNDDYKSVYLGLELNMPLGKESKATYEDRIARLRKQQADFEVKGKENSIESRIAAIIQNLNLAYQEVQYNQSIVDQQQHILQAFNTEREAGNRDISSLMQQELELNRAKEDFVTAKVLYQNLLISLWAEEGTLLSKFGLEPTDGI